MKIFFMNSFIKKYLWALQDLNLRPTDYAYHYGFRHPFSLWSGLCLHPLGMVAVKSLHLPFLEGLARRWDLKPFTEFDNLLPQNCFHGDPSIKSAALPLS